MLNRNGLCCLLIAAMFSSCAERAHRFVYAAQAANVPYLSKKGDAKVTAYFSGDGDPQCDGFNIQGAYALTKRWTVLGSYSHKRELQTYNYESYRFGSSNIFFNNNVETNIFDSSVVKYKRSFFDIGIGYHVPLNWTESFSFSWYAGVSLGKFSMADAGLDSTAKPYMRNYSQNSTKPWLQLALNYSNAKGIVNLSGGCKFSLLYYGSVNTNYAPVELNYFYLNNIYNQTYFLWEPYFNLQLGLPKIPWLKIDGQVSANTGLGNDHAEVPKVKGINGSIGVTFYLKNGLFGKKPVQ